MKNEAEKIDNQQGNGVLPCISGSYFIVKVDDGFCEWEYGFTLDNACINDLIKAIESKLKTKHDYQKMTCGAD